MPSQTPSKPPVPSREQQSAVGFTQEGARRIVRATQTTEHRNRNTDVPRARYPAPSLDVLRLAKTTSTITAKSGTTLGKGTAKLYDIDLSTSPETATLLDQEVTVYNWFGVVATDKDIYIGKVQGVWFVTLVPC